MEYAWETNASPEKPRTLLREKKKKKKEKRKKERNGNALVTRAVIPVIP